MGASGGGTILNGSEGDGDGNAYYGDGTMGSVTGTLIGGGDGNNSAFGFYALAQITSGYNNTAVGYQSLYSLNSGYGTAVGYQSLYSLTTAAL